MAIEIKRGPETSSRWSGDGNEGTMMAFEDGIALRGKVAAGPGRSELEFKIKPTDFAELAELMARVDNDAAARAFGLALAGAFELVALEGEADPRGID